MQEAAGEPGMESTQIALGGCRGAAVGTGLQQRADPPPPIAGRHCCSAQVSGGPAAQPQQLPTSTAGGEGVQRPNYTGKGDPAAQPHVALCSVLRALCFVQCLHSVAQCSSSGCQCGAGGLQPCTVCAAAVCILGLSCSPWALPVGRGGGWGGITLCLLHFHCSLLRV